MHGTPVFRGTRVPVRTVFDYLENGESLDRFLEGFLSVSRELAIPGLMRILLDEYVDQRLRLLLVGLDFHTARIRRTRARRNCLASSRTFLG